MIPGFEGLVPRYGDLHNHCDLSYGRGTPQEALANARLQLDFVSLTVHGAWPDVPVADPRLGYLVDYHQRGFERARDAWPAYLRLMDDADEPGRFVTLPSFEWHSLAYGDHCVYYRDGAYGSILDASDLPSLRAALAAEPGPTLLIPHHIGYQHGHRGIDWDAFDPAWSPLAEIVSFHGSAESCDGPVPYLHAMGPRDERGTARHGWQRGLRFGVVGSTDHHNAVPGAYGFGRLGAWLASCDRAGLWEALTARRTYALTGDRIALAFSLNGVAMGGVAAPDDERRIEVDVRGGHGIDYVEVLHNERILHRESVIPLPEARDLGSVKVHVEVGWGEAATAVAWDVRVRVVDGELVDVEPRFRGPFPSAPPPEDGVHAPHTLERCGADTVRFTTRTRPNPLSAVPAMEGVCLELRADDASLLEVEANGQWLQIPVRHLRRGAQTHHVDGFVSPAVCLHRAVPEREFARRFEVHHRARSERADWYRVRVRQRNDQWAWGSPVWVEPSAPTRR